MTLTSRIAVGIFLSHGLGDLGSTLACYALLGGGAEANPLMRWALDHGFATAALLMLGTVGLASLGYAVIGERWDVPGWRAFGLFQIAVGLLVTAINLYVISLNM